MEKYKSLGGLTVFFRLSLSNENLHGYFSTNFALLHHYKWSLTEVEDMLPWEREIYLSLLMKHLEEEKQREQQQAANRS